MHVMEMVFVLMQNAMCRCGMSARGDNSVVDGVLACYNGMKFRFNDLVDVIVGTVPGVRANKSEPFKGRFKGVVETERGVEFLVRPIVGSGKGRCMQLPQHSVFKVNAFGACVLGTRTTRYFSQLQPAQKERYVFIFLPCPLLFIFFYV